MKEDDDRCMDFSVRLFRVIGCWPNWKRQEERKERLYLGYTAVTYALLFVYTTVLAYGLTIHYKYWDSLEEAIEDIIVFATGFIVLVKLSLILWNQRKLQKMIDYINDDLNLRQVQDEDDTSVIKACIRHERSLTKTFVFAGYCITALYTASSIIRIISERATSGDYYILPLKYPFHPKSFPFYHLLYLHQIIVMTLNGHIGTLADTFFSCLTFYICGHFKIIHKRLAKKKRIDKRFFFYHLEIITLVDNLQSIFGFFLMFQLMINSLLLCLGLLQITQTADIKLLHYIKCLIYVLIKLSQMFLYCWYGQEIIKRSSEISFGAYSEIWHEFQDRRTAFKLQMLMLRSQKPVKVRAGVYFVLSLPTLAKVMNTAYSFFTMIKSSQKAKVHA